MNLPMHTLNDANLSSGQRVICIQVKTLPLSIVSLWFQAGSRYAPEGKDGLPHLFEHMFLTRNRNCLNKEDFAAKIEQLGFIYNAYTSRDLVNYHLLCPPDKEIQALNQLIKAYQTAIIRQEDLDYEKRIIINEENRNQSSLANYIWRIADRGVWPGTGLSRDIYGFPKTIDSITLGDIKGFKDKYYCTNNMTILIITPLKLKMDKIRSLTNIFDSNKTNKFPIADYTKVEKYIGKTRDINDIHVAVSYRYKSLSNKEEAIMRFLSHCFAGSWYSRFVRILRLQKKYTYWVSSRVYSTYDTSCLRFYYTIQKRNLEESFEIINNELELVRSRGLNNKELSSYKKSFLIRQLSKAADPYLMLRFYGRYGIASGQKIWLYDDFINTVREIKNEDLEGILSDGILINSRSIATIGNMSK